MSLDSTAASSEDDGEAGAAGGGGARNGTGDESDPEGTTSLLNLDQGVALETSLAIVVEPILFVLTVTFCFRFFCFLMRTGRGRGPSGRAQRHAM